MSDRLAFWDDLRQDLEDPGFTREYTEATVLIQTLDLLARGDGRPTQSLRPQW